MKFSLITKGKKAEKSAVFPLADGNGATVDVPVILVPLSGVEETEAIRYGLEYASKNGSKAPTQNDPLFDIAFMAKVLEFAVKDADSPPGARTPFFDGGTESILKGLTRDQRAFLFEHAEAWQDECSPFTRKMTENELFAAVAICAKGGSEADRFLAVLSPGMRRSFTLTTAVLAWNSLAPKSSSGSFETATTTSSPSSGPSEPKKRAKPKSDA